MGQSPDYWKGYRDANYDVWLSGLSMTPQKRGVTTYEKGYNAGLAALKKKHRIDISFDHKINYKL